MAAILGTIPFVSVAVSVGTSARDGRNPTVPEPASHSVSSIVLRWTS